MFRMHVQSPVDMIPLWEFKSMLAIWGTLFPVLLPDHSRLQGLTAVVTAVRKDFSAQLALLTQANTIVSAMPTDFHGFRRI